MSSRKKVILIAGLLFLIGSSLVVAGYVGEHNRDVAAAERVGQPNEDDGGSSSIGAFVAIFAALLAASQAKKSKQGGNKNG